MVVHGLCHHLYTITLAIYSVKKQSVVGYNGQLKYTVFVTPVGPATLFYACTEASFSPNLTDALHLQLPLVFRSPDLVYFYAHDCDGNNNRTDGDGTGVLDRATRPIR